MKTVSNVVHDFPARQREDARAGADVDRPARLPPERDRAGGSRPAGPASSPWRWRRHHPVLRRARPDDLHPLPRSAATALLLEQTDSSIEEERAIVSPSEAGLVDGVIFQPAAMSSASEIAKHRSDVPIVLLGEAPAPVGLDHVMIDNVDAARDRHAPPGVARTRAASASSATRGPAPAETSKIRIMGYQRGLEPEGLPVDLGLLVASDAISAQAAAAALGAALDGGLRFDALVCRDDLAAIGALRALRSAASTCPDDVAVTGWDDIAMASFTQPTLTTVRPDTTALADTALDLLEERIRGFEGLGRHA